MELPDPEPQKGAKLDHALLAEHVDLEGDAELQAILAEHLPRFRRQVSECLAAGLADADGGKPWLAYAMWQENVGEFH